jgi:hypothetical protein
VTHEFRRSVGWFQRKPRITPTSTGSGRRSDVYQPRSSLRDTAAGAALTVERADRVVSGQYEAFGHDWRTLPIGSAGWSTHPRTGYRFPAGAWWQVPHLPSGHDIKDVWEPGRFAWVYDLVRAYTRTQDSKYADAFHQRFKEWCDSNPPFYGVQWACGQEAAIRALALLHAEESLPVARNDARLMTLLASSGERIADAIGYGLSQRNNHGISESAGLIHLGLRLRGAHPHADTWVRTGRRWLEEQIRDQFYEDGWYAQHSFTYLRVALEQVLLAQRALSAHGLSLSEQALALARASANLLGLVIDPATGHVPNHGANDGGRVALYSSAPYRDFRPVLTLAALILDTPFPADAAPDAEVCAWLGRRPVLQRSPEVDGVRAGTSGWAVARVGRAFVFLRAGSYRHRPSHLDCLHIDVRMRGSEVVVDPGTFAYNAPEPWNNPFVSAAVHNGPLADGVEPGKRGPRFLWFTWPTAELTKASYEGARVVLAAEMPRRLARKVIVEPDRVCVVDSALDSAIQRLDVTWTLSAVAPAALEIVQGEVFEDAADERLGWFSPTYGKKERARVLRVRGKRSAAGSLEIETRICAH